MLYASGRFLTVLSVKYSIKIKDSLITGCLFLLYARKFAVKVGGGSIKLQSDLRLRDAADPNFVRVWSRRTRRGHTPSVTP